MHKYTAKDTDKCLKSKRVVFVGDSVTRQLFFSMAHLADPTLPSAPPTSFEKHSDHSFTSGTGTWFDFFWDPFLNSTKTAALLKGNGYGGRDTPALLVIGSGLWFLRYAEDTGGISAWEATIERALDTISKSAPGLADEVIILPVQEPDETKLSPERATFINNADVDAMNSDIVHRLAPDSPTFNDRERLPDPDSSTQAPSQTGVRVMFPSVFNRMLDPSLTEDGLHYNEVITTYQAQLLLNLRCNDALPKKYPLDKTCCSRYPRPPVIQLITLFMLTLYGPVALMLRWNFPDNDWISWLSPGGELISPLSTFGLAIGLCFIADRTGLWLKEQKQFNAVTFSALSCLALITGLFTTHRGSKDLGFLNRDQTNEWKGWMQLAILIYHYLGGSRISGIYAPVRVLVASYLALTGYGHTSYYLQKADFGVHRVFHILVRLNLLTVALAYAMNTNYMFYYFAPLVSFWYLVVYATMRVGKQYNDRLGFLLGKVVMSALAVAVLHSSPVILEPLFRILGTVCNIHYDVSEWLFRVNLDIFIVYVGMIAAIVYGRSRDLHITDHPKWPWIHRGGLTVCGLGLIWFFAFELSRQDKFTYNEQHPYVSIIPVVAFVLLRNATPVLRVGSSQFFAFVGKCSLETYILQYHIWLAGDTKGILVVVPGIAWRPVNFLVTSIIFLWVSYKVAEATGELSNYICGVKPLELPTASRPANTDVSDTLRAHERDQQQMQHPSNEESIPLVERIEGASTDLMHQNDEKGSATQLQTDIIQPEANLSEQSRAFDTRQDHSNEVDPSFSFLRSHLLGQPWSIPTRIVCILIGLWVVNLAWLFTPPLE